MPKNQQSGSRTPAFLYAAGLTLFVFTIALAYSTALGAGWWWDLAGGLGFMALAQLALLNIATGQGTRLSSHKVLGWSAVGLSAAHAGIYLGTDALVIEHLKLSAPPAMLIGVGAMLVATLGASLSLSRWKLKVHGSRDNFRRYHRLMSWVVLLGVLYHVAATSHSVHRPEQFVVLGAAALAILVLARKIAASLNTGISMPSLWLFSLLALGVFVGVRNV